MQYQFVFAKNVKPDPKDIPTHVSVGGRQYNVEDDGVVDAPARFQEELKGLGFTVRQRPSIAIRSSEPAIDDGAEVQPSPLDTSEQTAASASVENEGEPEELEAQRARDDRSRAGRIRREK